MEANLLYLVADLMQDRGLRFHFNRDPEGVMRQYGLRAVERHVLMTMDHNKIGAMIRREFLRWGFPDDGIPVDEHCRNPAGGTDYPAPDPQAFRVLDDPLDVSQKKYFSIYGQSFSPDAAVELVAPDGSSLSEGTDFEVHRRGTFRCSEILVHFKKDPAQIATGPYVVTVTCNPNAGPRLRIDLGPLELMVL